MNDVYVTTFLVLAALLFAPLYLGPRRPWTAVALLVGRRHRARPGAGLQVGGPLCHRRPRAARAAALRPGPHHRAAGHDRPDGGAGRHGRPPRARGRPARNWLFLLLMLLLTGLLAAAMRAPAAAGHARRAPPGHRGAAGGRRDARSSSASWRPPPGRGPIAEGAVRSGETSTRRRPSPRPGAAPGGRRPRHPVGLGAAVIAWLAARAGRGPWAPEVTSRSRSRHRGRARRTPAMSRRAGLAAARAPWRTALALHPGLPDARAAGRLHRLLRAVGRAGQQLGAAAHREPALHARRAATTGQTLADLTASMYRYHDNLRAAHAASSPWWAWPLDLKPVWFFSEGYAGRSTGLIYDTGNLVIFWLGIAAMAFARWAAWRRRSLSLTLLVILWAALWLPWARIDRATFQYHVYASLPFAGPGAGLPPGRAVARPEPADLVPGAGRRGAGHPGRRCSCGCCGRRCASWPARRRPTQEARPAPPR